jgi:hypothetical protein
MNPCEPSIYPPAKELIPSALASFPIANELVSLLYLYPSI